MREKEREERKLTDLRERLSRAGGRERGETVRKIEGYSVGARQRLEGGEGSTRVRERGEGSKR